ncbi:MAG: NADH-quinone oxidoreductase subunit H [Sulfolobales archaeon]|nr:NADH-quinone oxidoreductase subunit H [Sulfolobales archaeon]MDW8082917.1 NADH-quinone oxidoreductase subunit H [Sulfolobales archaeon]
MLHSIAIAILQLALAPVYDGVERKVRAAIHTRIGPPVLQTWYDLIKLFSKEVVIPVGGGWYTLVTVLEMLTLVTASILLVHVSTVGLAQATIFEAVIFIVLTGIATTLAIMRAVSQNNVFSVLGGFREFSLVLSAEPFLAVSLLLLVSGVEAAASRAIAALILLIAAYVVSGRVPYDIAEAEPELASGVNIELAGPLLGVATVSAVLKKFISATLTVLVFVLLGGLSGLTSLTAVALLTPLTWITHTVVSTLLGRSRVDLAVRFLYTTLFILSSMLLVSYGLGV